MKFVAEVFNLASISGLVPDSPSVRERIISSLLGVALRTSCFERLTRNVTNNIMVPHKPRPVISWSKNSAWGGLSAPIRPHGVAHSRAAAGDVAQALEPKHPDCSRQCCYYQLASKGSAVPSKPRVCSCGTRRVHVTPGHTSEHQGSDERDSNISSNDGQESSTA